MNNFGNVNYQALATIIKPFGLFGEVYLKPVSRYFEQYINCSDLSLSHGSATRYPIKITSIKASGKKKIFKLEGFNSRVEVQKIVGYTIFVKVPIGDKINQISKDLIGWEVISISKIYIGKLIDIMWCPSNDVYIVKNDDKEYLIPVVDSFVKEINYNQKQIIIKPIDGLVE